MATHIDLNCDLGEGLGPWTLGEPGTDEALLSVVTSANVACGFHAGDPSIMAARCATALARGVAVGAHVAYRDLVGFGRRRLDVPPGELAAEVSYQVGALQAMARSQGGRLHHVKTHGALYTLTARDPALADAVARAVADVDPALPIYVANAAIAQATRERGVSVPSSVYEVYADRSYQDDGTLTPRSQPHAMIEDVDQAIAQVKRMVKEGVVRALSGKDVPITADTLCIHGDQPGAALFARRIRAALEAEGIEIRTV